MKSIEIVDLPPSSVGTQRHLKVIQFKGHEAQKKAYLQAGLHADEPPGLLVMQHLVDLLDQAEQEGRIKEEIVLVPVANPVGLSQWISDKLVGRFYAFNGVNFNRQYPDVLDKVVAKVKGQLTDSADTNVLVVRAAMRECVQALPGAEEVDFLKKRLIGLACDSDVTLDLHCDFEAMLYLYTRRDPSPETLSNYLGAELTILEEATPERTFDQFSSQIWWDLAERFPDFPIPQACLSATIELRGDVDVNHDLAQKDAQNIFNFLLHEGYIKGDVPPPQQESSPNFPLMGNEYLVSNIPGIIIFHKEVGDFVKAGDVVVEVLNPLANDPDQAKELICATTDGLFFARIKDRYARPGRPMGKIAGKKELEREGNLLTL